MTSKVFVMGGTGLLGEPVAQKLAEAGFGVRVLARNVEKARKMFGGAVEIVEGDVMDAGAVRAGLAGCSAVHISLAYGVEMPAIQNVLDAAGETSLERIVYISGTTVCEENRWFGIVDEKVSAENAIKASGIPYTIFRPSWFMEMLANFIKNGRALLIGKHPYPYHWVSRDDFARMVVTAYSLDETLGKCLYIHGPDVFFLQEALLRYCAALHPEIKKLTNFPVPLAKIVATLTGNKSMKMGANMMAYFSKVGEPGDPAESNRLLGAPTTTLDEWLASEQTVKSTLRERK